MADTSRAFPLPGIKEQASFSLLLVSPAHPPDSVLFCAGVKRHCQAGGAGGEHETIGVLPPFSESSGLLVDNPREVV